MKDKTSIKLYSIFLLIFFISEADLYGSNTPSQMRHLEERVWIAGESDFPPLEREITRTIQINSHSSFSHYLLAYLYLRQYATRPSDLFLLKKAAELAQQSIELEEDKPHGYAAIADILDALGQPEQAAKILKTYQSSATDNSWHIHFGLARLTSDRLSSSATLQLLEKAMAAPNSQRNIIAPYVVAILQSAFGQKEAMEKLKNWQAKFPNATFLHTLAVLFSQEGKFEKAHQLYQDLYRVNPNLKEAQINNAIILYKNLDRKNEAATILQRLITSNQLSILDAFSQELVHTYLAAIHLDEKNFTLAANHIIEATKISHSPLETLRFATENYRKRGYPKKLIPVLRELNLVVPGNSSFYALLGEVHSEDLGEYQLALEAYANAIVLEPSRSDFYTGMGLTYYRMNLMKKALSLFSTATKIDPRDAVAKYNKACALARLGHSKEALMDLEQALILQPNLAATAITDSDLTSLRHHSTFQKLTEYQSH